MASNQFGICLRITTWGESHGPAIGVVLDGVPSGLSLSLSEINAALARRRPGQSPYVSPRQEKDEAEILSGVFEGKTTGAPISILIPNTDVKSDAYSPIQNLFRPGHAQFTYHKKYQTFDPLGGGRASARETATRVAAGVVAQKILEMHGIQIASYIQEIGGIVATIPEEPLARRQKSLSSPLFCPDEVATLVIQELLSSTMAEGDSLGGIVETVVWNVPAGLGDPIYEKIEARLAYAMLSLPASKGFEIGAGFASARMRGSTHNDPITGIDRMATNHAGGTLGGITTGENLLFRVAFKPTSSILIPQATVDMQGNPQTLQLPSGSRHDPCVAIRAVPVVEAMTALVLADALLMSHTNQS